MSYSPRAAGGHAAANGGMQDVNQTAEFFLSNYRLGKTLGIGSFGKVLVISPQMPMQRSP